jgi:hypothetical protein
MNHQAYLVALDRIENSINSIHSHSHHTDEEVSQARKDVTLAIANLRNLSSCTHTCSNSAQQSNSSEPSSNA